MSTRESSEYALITSAYRGLCAKRSGVPYQRHIEDGLAILSALGASERAARAFCLHPLVQGDAAFAENLDALKTADPIVVALAVEYRRVANAYLSKHGLRNPSEIDLGPLSEVADMLRADKVQNYAEFLRNHRSTHPRATELDAYVQSWLSRLGIDEARFQELCAATDTQEEVG